MGGCVDGGTAHHGGLRLAGKMGHRVLWCARCRAYHPMADGPDNDCPECGAFMTLRRCYRCGYEWVPRDFSRGPDTCPHCKSPYWCRTRVRG